jgi:hypothetical protein
LRAETTAISAMAKIPFKMIKNSTIIASNKTEGTGFFSPPFDNGELE